MEGISVEEGLEKFCGKCKTLVPIDNFHRQVDSKDGFRYNCKDCVKPYSKNRYRKRKREAKKHGICIKFGCDIKTLDKSRICRTHFYQGVALTTLKKKSLWEDLERIADRQGYVCPLTGDKLVAGINMSLDHIKPVSRFPELRTDIDNLQWLTKWANVSKSNLDLEEFIVNCFKVTKRCN